MSKKKGNNLNSGNILKKNIKVGIMPAESAEKDPAGYFNLIVWEAVKKKLQERGVTVTEIGADKTSYDGEIKKLAKDKYDMLVGGFSVLHRRALLANYTKPLLLDQQIIIFEPPYSFDNTYLYKLLEIIVPITIIFLVLGTVFSLSLFFFGKHYSTKKNRLRWHFWGVFGALLGEPGTIVEKIKITNSYNIIIATFILLFVFFFSLLLEAAFTAKIYDDSIEADDDPIGLNIKDQKFLAIENSSQVDTLKNANAKPVLVKNVKYTEIQDHYIKNKNEVKGFISDMSTWGTIKKNYPTFKRSDYKFPFDESAWLVNKKETGLLSAIDDILIELREKKIIEKECRKYLPWYPKLYCSI